jgi:hypothetical protein
MSAVSDMQQINDWFLGRGLPLVLTRRVRSRDLIVRSAPVVSGVGALTATTMLLAEVSGDTLTTATRCVWASSPRS